MKFRFCNYWRTWNRVLNEDNGRYREVDCTPVNGFRQGNEHNIRDCAAINIREHCTDTSGDIVAQELPVDVLASMVDHLGQPVVDFILHPELEDMIDWKLQKKYNNGGTPLRLCLLERLEGKVWVWDEAPDGDDFGTMRRYKRII